jgi:hypothetical protein
MTIPTDEGAVVRRLCALYCSAMRVREEAVADARRDFEGAEDADEALAAAFRVLALAPLADDEYRQRIQISTTHVLDIANPSTNNGGTQ